jgi:hypothetical protein
LAKERGAIMQLETIVQWMVETLLITAGIAAGSLMTLALGC